MKRISIPLMWIIAIFLNADVFGQDQTYNTCSSFLEIKASDGSLDYKWDVAPGLQSPNLQATLILPVPAGTSTYTVRSKVTEGTNLVSNGDFELGNTGFTSEYTYWQHGNGAQLEQGLYSVTAPGETANNYNIGFVKKADHSGTGQMLIADGACGTNGVPGQATVWKQDITVEPNTDYIFSAWMTNVALNGVSSSLRFSINGAVIGTPASTLNQAGVWGQFYVTWNSGSATTAEIAIAEQTAVCGGNDFAIDDIAFNKIKEIVETIQVIKGPPTEKATISGANSLCSSSTTTLQASIGGGKWASSDGTVATINSTTGVITPKKVGTTQITYTLGGTCGTTVSDPFEVTITASAVTPVISGNHSFCMNGTLNLTSSVSGGNWTSSNTAIATIDASGKVTPVSTGTTNITYSTSGSCGNATSSPFAVTVSAPPVTPMITGNHSLCLAETINITNSATGGTWASSNTAVATIDASGKVTAISAGTTNITYIISSSCGNVSSDPFDVTVNATAVPPTITGDNSLCLASNISLTGSVSGGTWVSSDISIATIDASGKITPVSPGTTNITYKVTSSCGNATSDPFAVTVNTPPTAPVITGDSFLCLPNGTLNLTPSATGGTWKSSDISIATIDASGKVTPVSAGTTNITYTVSSACGGDVPSADFPVTVNATQQLGEITGTATLNIGQQSTLTIDLPGGTWASSDGTVVEISADGTVRGLKGGESDITYSLTTPCEELVSTFKITVVSVHDLYVPNAFTPNSDGNNDEFRIYGSTIDKIDFEIFNQWGELVYKTTDPAKGWEGAYKGEKQPAGVYIYTAKLKLIDGKEITKKGAVNLIR